MNIVEICISFLTLLHLTSSLKTMSVEFRKILNVAQFRQLSATFISVTSREHKKRLKISVGQQQQRIVSHVECRIKYFSGNDNLNILTSTKRYKLRIDLADFENNTRYAEYDNFVVQSSNENYRLSSLGTYSGTAGKKS